MQEQARLVMRATLTPAIALHPSVKPIEVQWHLQASSGVLTAVNIEKSMLKSV